MFLIVVDNRNRAVGLLDAVDGNARRGSTGKLSIAGTVANKISPLAFRVNGHLIRNSLPFKNLLPLSIQTDPLLTLV